MVQSSAGSRSGGPPRILGTLSEKRLSVLPSASRTSRLEYQLDFATGLFSQSVWAKSGSLGVLEKGDDLPLAAVEAGQGLLDEEIAPGFLGQDGMGDRRFEEPVGPDGAQAVDRTREP